MNSYDPREQIRGIHQILISDKKRIGFLFGAGSSLATGIDNTRVPAIEAMTKQIITAVTEGNLTPPADFGNAIVEIKSEIEKNNIPFNIESLLSNIEAKRAVIGEGTLNGLNATNFTELSNLIKINVEKLVSIHERLHADDHKKLAHVQLSSWIQKARRRFPAEIFTTNYDYLFEIALESLGIPYFDGFSGSFEPFFCPEAVEDISAYPHLVKLWKMHGSLGWTYRESDKTVIRRKLTNEDSILIYPSHLKYNSSRKQPYVGLIDRLCTFLQQDDAVLFICGYSFGDDHINERIITSLRRGANSHVIVLYYDEIANVENKTFALSEETNHIRRLATRETGGKMSVYGIRHAIVGGKFAEWKLRDKPDAFTLAQIGQYFTLDAAETGSEDKNWKETGSFLLPDFQKFTRFLNDLLPPTFENIKQ